MNFFQYLIITYFIRELEKILTKEPTMFELDTEDNSQFRKIMFTLMGTNTHKFIEISPLHYQQLDVISFHQMKIEKYLIDVSEIFKELFK